MRMSGVAVLSLAAASLCAGPVVTTTTDATALANALLGTGITLVGTPTLVGTGTQQGTFTNGPLSTVGFANGIVLTSGSAAAAAGNYAGPDLPDVNLSTPGDSDLSALIGGQATNDANTLTFQFKSTVSTVGFSYTFASAEYPNFIGSFNDPFGFFVNGVNRAMIPGTNTPVTVNDVNVTTNPGFFGCFTGGAACYNSTGAESPYGGQTKVLSFSAPVSTTGVNTIKISVADALDNQLDSAVFIQAGSFTQPTTSPEPATFLLLGISLAGVIGGARSKARR